MIKVNLVERKKKIAISNFMGINLKNLSIKGWLFFLVVYSLPPYIVHPYFDGEVKLIEDETALIRKQTKKLRVQTKGNTNLKEQLSAFSQRVNQLNDLEKNVKKILDTKTSPLQILLHVAKKIPEDMWLTSMSITDGNINIAGRSRSFKSLGDFVGNANNSIFFNRSLNISSSESKEEDLNNDGKVDRFEEFNISGTIDRFE